MGRLARPILFLIHYLARDAEREVARVAGNVEDVGIARDFVLAG